MHIKPLKQFSQNFLINEVVAENIVNSLIIKNDDCVMEIGPGKGILTQYLLSKTENVKFIEIDKNMVLYLKNKYSSIADKIIEYDVLKLDWKNIFYNKPLNIIGNFPYNITGELILKIVENRNVIKQVICMLQKEVVNKIMSKPNFKIYGVYTILLQTYYHIEFLFDVPASDFSPQPKVTSAVVRLIRNDRKKLECDENLFNEIIHTAFNYRRKKLSNALNVYSNIANIDERYLNMRAEQLTIDDFIKITYQLSNN